MCVFPSLQAHLPADVIHCTNKKGPPEKLKTGHLWNGTQHRKETQSCSLYDQNSPHWTKFPPCCPSDAKLRSPSCSLQCLLALPATKQVGFRFNWHNNETQSKFVVCNNLRHIACVCVCVCVCGLSLRHCWSCLNSHQAQSHSIHVRGTRPTWPEGN